ncbi:hypothetical protein BJ741DRAFT_706820 [Chytriomyces cf. hyalinus JEL632]|nr:hypothetical protein BJ741DRAFT_706820 [Chytriomyces cf. hyalinus JEL632]
MLGDWYPQGPRLGRMKASCWTWTARLRMSSRQGGRASQSHKNKLRREALRENRTSGERSELRDLSERITKSMCDLREAVLGIEGMKECCTSETESPQLFERVGGKWKQNRYILLVVALVIIAAIVLNVSLSKAAPKH